jgi:hypothetical protein
MQKFNNWLGDKMAFWLATMACFWIVTVLVIMPLFWQRPHTLVEWMQYLISVFFQGIALPVLGYVARVAGDKQERLLKETHDTVMLELAEMKEIINLLNNSNGGMENEK